MNLNLGNLRHDQLAALLNSTRFGTVTTTARVRNAVVKGGLRIGDSRRVNAFAYVAHTLERWHQKHQQPARLDRYEARKDSENQRRKAQSRTARDIADKMEEEPAVLNPDRRTRCREDLASFCREYLPASFTLPWSNDHKKVIRKIEQAVLHGELFAIAMPRGTGKTTLIEAAALWALLNGHRRYICLIGATSERARSMLDSIKTELECNDTILEDFRREVFPIHALERIHNRANGQTYEGEPTRIVWTQDRIIMPTLDASAASGAIVTVTGLESGNIRGQKHKLADGTVIRPSLVILDDPQTHESANSPLQCAQRLAILNGDVLGMAGPGKRIAGLAAVTVIRPGDMADSLLDRTKAPRWQGERCKLMYAMPSNTSMWERYATLRAESQRNGTDGKEATDFYRQHQAEMDAGAEPAWPERFNVDTELSAIQHAMNLYIDDPSGFACEYQNEPIVEKGDQIAMMSASEIAGKVNGIPRASVPSDTQHITTFIDVHDDLLYWTVAAWSDTFSGWIIDYGTWPEQPGRLFAKRKATKTLQTITPTAGREGAIRAGLETLANHLLTREWTRADGVPYRIARGLVDSGYVPAVVDDFCRYSKHAAILIPSRGLGIGAAKRPISEYQQRPGDQYGLNWYVSKPAGKQILRTARYDANFWKTFLMSRFAVLLGDAGSLSLYGHRPEDHRQIAEHITAERPVRTFGNGRWVDEWRLAPGSTDNHWLDCLVGCAVAASMLGSALAGITQTTKSKRKVYTAADLRRGPFVLIR